MTYPIPAKALVSHIAILGKAGSGKTWAAKGLVEEVLDRGERACVIDPTGVWHGLRTSASGKRAGYPVAIFGGEHGDFPLAGTHGEALAEIVALSSTPVIIDTSLMRVGERTRFFADFGDAIMRKNKGPLHVVVDEAHLFAPQGRVNDPQSGAMLHAANNMVSLGRARGLRIVLISQRPAKLHKDSLTQAETLVAMRLIAPQDRKAIEAWIEDNADEAKAREILSSLATLKTGEAWVWSPMLGVLDRVKFPPIRTLDTSAAPVAGDKEIERVLAPIDRDAITAKLGSIAKEAEANDPRKLRARIAELERAAAAKPKELAVDVELLAKNEQAGYRRGWSECAERARELVREALQGVEKAPTPVRGSVITHHQAVRDATYGALPLRKQPPRIVSKMSHGNGAGVKLKGAERKILTALAQYRDGRSKVQVAVLTGYAHSGGGFNNALGALRGRGSIEGGDTLTITSTGLDELGAFDPLPSGQELLQHWFRQLKKAEREALAALTAAYPGALTKEELAAATPTRYEPSGGGFNNALGRLRTLELVTSDRGALRASDHLFDS